MGYVKRGRLDDAGLKGADQIGFLLLGGIHQCLHLVPAAAALASIGNKVVVYVTCQEEEIWCREILARLGAPPIPIIPLLPPRWSRLAGKLNGRWLKPKAAILLNNRKKLNSLLALVVAERTSTLLKRLPGRKPFMIHIPHGAGDRAKGFEKRIKLFDHTIVAGNKDKRRMLSAGLVSDRTCSVSGYLKAAAVNKMNLNVPEFFQTDRPTILYNPHFDRKLSSWWKFGRDILKYFENQTRFNLIVAPHIKLWNDLSEEDRSFLKSFEDCPHIIIDVDSRHLIDMSYVKYSNIYLGDVSSQVYEFIIDPRPCVFILPDGVDFSTEEDYAHCRFGDVCFDSSKLFTALEASQQRHGIYEDVQRTGTFEALGEPSLASIDRAAAIITKVVEGRAAQSSMMKAASLS